MAPIAHPVGHAKHKLGDDEEHDDGTLHIHAGDLKLYIGIFAALIFFTVLTVVTSTPESRIIAGVAVAFTCTVTGMLFFLTVNALESRQRRK